MGSTTNTTADGLPILGGHQHEDTGGLPILKKKDAPGAGPTPSPSGSSPKPVPTAPPVDTSASGSKTVTANFKNNSLTPKDVGDNSASWSSPSPEQIANALNNKGKNIDKWKNSPSNLSSSFLVKEKQETDQELSKLEQTPMSVTEYGQQAVDAHKQKIESLKAKREYLNTEIGKNYSFEKRSLVPELVDLLKGQVDDSEFDPQTHQLKPVSVQWVARHVDDIMNKKKNSSVNAAVSGDLDDKERTYADITKSVVDQLNLIPVEKAKHKFAQEYAQKNPEIAEALKANEDIHSYFSNSNFDDVVAKVKINVDKDLINAKERYKGAEGIFQKSQEYVGIQHKYAQLVADGKMTDEVARKQMKAEIEQSPALKKIQSAYETENKKIIENSQKEYQKYVVDGLQKKHPEYTIYSDGTPGLSSMTEDKYKKMVEGYQKGIEDVGKSMGVETNEQLKALSNAKAQAQGPLWGSLSSSTNALMSGLTKMIFNKTGWGGDRVRNFEANEIASPDVSQSDVAATWNWKGYESLVNPNFYLSGLGSTIPVIAGAAAVTATTEGGGLPEYVGWISSAGLFTAQSSLSTYNQLLSTKDENGNMISESDASRLTADQAAKDFLPNVLMMALTSGVLAKAKGIVKPTFSKAIRQAGVGAVEAQPFMTWQGYNDYATFQKAQGKEPDFYDYMQSKDFRDNLANGLIMGGGLGLVHAPFNHMKAMDKWTKLVHSSEGDFKNLIPQNYALGQEMAGNGDYLRDALKLHVFNIDPDELNEEGKRQLADLKNTLLYSTNLNRNIEVGNLDRTNVNDLYQAHNLALADQNDYLADQAAKEGNKSLSDIYKAKAKDYREQAKGAADGSAKYHYLINDEGQPIFMSDKSFKTLESDGKISQWIKDKTIQGVHASDDPEFAQRYKDFVSAKDESTVDGKDVEDHAADLIEQNKDRLGVYYAAAKENPEAFYKEIADQIAGINADGSSSLRPDAESAARDQYGDDIVDLAKLLHPITEKEGGLNEELSISEEGTDQSKEDSTGAEGKDGRLPEGQQNGGAGSPTASQKVAPEDNITVSEMLDKKGIYKGQRGTFVQDGQTVIFKTDKGNREYELGNVNEIGQRGIHEFGIDQKRSVVDTNDKGNVVVRGKEYENKYSDPLRAINYDKDGNIISVTLSTPDGENRTFRGPVGEDIAYQITLKQISNEQPEFERFINEDAGAQKEMDDAGLSKAPEEVTASNNEPIPREKIEPAKIEEISSPKSESDGKDETKEAEGREGDVLTPKEEETTAEAEPVVPPSKPPTEVRTPKESPKDEFTAIRKEKQVEIKGAKKLFERQNRIKWTEIYDNALKNLQSMYPGAGSLYDAMKSHVNEFVTKLDNNILFNPTSEDIAVFNVFKNETMARMNEIPGWNSPDNMQRMAALAEFTSLNNDLYNVVRINNPKGEAGRAFGLLQSEVAQDPEHGLKIRRMELLRAKGGRQLTEEDLAWTAEQWQKEREIIEKENELRQKGMQEKFDNELAAVRKEYEKRLQESKKEANPKTSKEKREKLLKEKGAELAAKIRSGKLRGTYATFPGLPQAINVVLEGVARLVEGGYTLAQAIDEYVAANKIKNKDQFTNDLFEVFKKQEKQEDSLGKIRDMAEAEGLTDITSEMVGRNLIKDFVDSHVGLHDPKDVIDVVHERLSEVLPDVQKEKLAEAYLKQGDYKQPTKKELESGFKESERNFNRLVKLEKDINDLNEKKNLYKRGNQKSETPYDKEVEAKELEKKAIMDSMGIKVSSEDKYKKASYDQRAKSHNERVDNLLSTIEGKLSGGGLSDKVERALTTLKAKLEAAKISIDPTSALSQDKVLEGGISLFNNLKSEFFRETNDNIPQTAEVRKALQKISDQFNVDKGESEENIKLQRAKDQAKRDAEKYSQKISRGEFEDKKQLPLTKSDAELIRLQRERDAIGKIYKDRKDEYARKHKSMYKRVADFARAAMVDWMIGGPMTLVKVAGSAVLRPNLEAATKLTFGKVFEVLPTDTTKAIADRARSGGESQSIKSIAKGYQAYFKQMGEKALGEKFEKANHAYEVADKEYIDQQNEVNRAKYAYGKDSEAYKIAEKELQQAKDKRNDALMDAVGNTVYEYIGGSSIREGLEVLLHRSTEMERQFGDFDREDFAKFNKDSNVKEKLAVAMDNVQHVMNFVGRSHAALKNFSARQSFASGFMARLEYAVSHDIDITHTDKLLEIAHESYLDWERGKYQESNWLTDAWNKATTAVENIDREGTKIRKAGEGLAYLMRADVAITRVPVNMLREGIMEYTLGAFRASAMAAKEYYKAKGIVLQDGYKPENEAQFREELKEQLAKMDQEQAATIVRAFRKGGFGLGLYALALLGSVSFGGWPHKGMSAEDAKRKKRDEELGIDEINTGEVRIGEWKMPEFAAKIAEHTPAFAPLGFGLGLAQVYKNNITEGKSTPASAINSAMAQINHITGSLPMIDKMVAPLATGAIKNVAPSGQWEDVDESGNPMKRKAFRGSDYFHYLGFGKKSDILSETYYKQAVSTQKSFREQITEVETNTSLSRAEKDQQRKELQQQLDEAIDDIYQQNKENPQ